MTKTATVEDVVSIAAQAHKGQKDKAGAPYLLHPLRMMMRMTSEAAMMAAVLHDVVEDTDWTIERLRAEGFSDEVLAAVDCLTHRDGESYQEFVERADGGGQGLPAPRSRPPARGFSCSVNSSGRRATRGVMFLPEGRE